MVFFCYFDTKNLEGFWSQTAPCPQTLPPMEAATANSSQIFLSPPRNTGTNESKCTLSFVHTCTHTCLIYIRVHLYSCLCTTHSSITRLFSLNTHLAICVTLSKLPGFSVPQFPHLWSGVDDTHKHLLQKVVGRRLNEQRCTQDLNDDCTINKYYTF
jgi:hypothetical protein